MGKVMKGVTGVSTCLFITCAIVSEYMDNSLLLSLAITFATITYHFGMRLAVGFIFNKIMGNRADYMKAWYQPYKIELRFYEKMKVKNWKNKMPSYDPELFSPLKHTWGEIAQAMCQAELVHETIIVFSFLPILASIYWGAFGVFLITSICAACVDLLFVIMQRYNRPRVIKLALKEKAIVKRSRV